MGTELERIPFVIPHLFILMLLLWLPATAFGTGTIVGHPNCKTAMAQSRRPTLPPWGGDPESAPLTLSAFEDPSGDLADISGSAARHLHDHYRDSSPRVVGIGGENIAIEFYRFEGDDMVSRVVRIPVTPEHARSREAMEREVNVSKEMREKFGAAADDSFVKIISSRTEPGVRVPEIITPYVNGGNLKARLSDIGTKLSFEETIDIFKKLGIPIQMLHTEDYVHMDVKPSNYLVEVEGGKIVKILLSDFGFIAKNGESPVVSSATTRAAITPLYSRPNQTFRALFGNSPKLKAEKQRDMYALMVTLQEALLGKSLTQIPEECTKATTAAFHADTLVLNRSPHSIDNKIPEVLSTLAWTEFKTIDKYMTAVKKAEEYQKQKNPDGFYRKFYGPKVLAKMTIEQAAAMIASDVALEKRFQKVNVLGMNGLGLNPIRRFLIQREIQRQKKAAQEAALSQTNDLPSPTN